MGKYSLTDRDLNVPFIDKDQLVENATPFVILGYDERTNTYQNKPRVESVFTIALVEGPDAGYEQLLTLGVTSARQRLGDTIKRKGPRGPIQLGKESESSTGKAYANPTYVFTPVEDAKLEKLAERIISDFLAGK